MGTLNEDRIMSDEIENSVVVTDRDLQASGLPSTMEMSPGLAIFFNDALYNRCKQIASHMAKADGMMPKHLIGKPEACFAIVSRAIVWKLDPFSVALSTYQTPGGSIGYEGKLIQAILENSGRLDGGILYQMKGDWNAVKGKFKLQDGRGGGKFPVPTWGPEDAKGLSVIVSAKIKGELEPRELEFELIEAFPLNSPLWATAPHRQIKYTAVRAFANQAVPSLLMGIPFDVDPTGFYGEPMTDITPARPQRNEFTREDAPVPKAETVHASPAEPAQYGGGQSSEAGEGVEETARQEAAQEPVADPKLETHKGKASGKKKPPEPDPQEVAQTAETVNRAFTDAEAMVGKMIESLSDKDMDLDDFKKSARTNIDGLEGLTEDERDILRGRFTTAFVTEQAARSKKGGRR
jgi:hypothetical protein